MSSNGWHTLPPACGAFPALEMLKAASNALTGAALAPLGGLTALRHLSLARNRVEGVTGAGVAGAHGAEALAAAGLAGGCAGCVSAWALLLLLRFQHILWNGYGHAQVVCFPPLLVAGIARPLI